ncbi:EamA-like transporter family protein [Candidatus Erwinia haradaeae]|uniref:EamA-like transporter family protein n=1 Tax=Candidatus Erwinia haradaeae TaxID=1922217 RepID=A0A451DD83_9GAMM|nr:DMT family transporter [Candidatus Erwinia haradaeae]VFP84369.1 EamA-like transporter family protein [Candidatus Erwinia haradaeae]
MSSVFSSYKFILKLPEAVLMFITMIWGGSFLIVNHIMTISGPFWFIGVRFAIATLILVLMSWRMLRMITLREIKAGILVGIAIGCGYSLQAYGMQTITGSKSAFITALYVPLIPLLQWIFLGLRPHLLSWTGVLLAFSGLLLLSSPHSGPLVFNKSEVATLLSTLAISAEIILISTYANQVNVQRITVVQLGVASLSSFLCMLLNSEPIPPCTPYLLYSTIGLGIASALIQITMNWAQCSVSPTRATIIYAGEPVWAGVCGHITGEYLSSRALLGGMLIIIGMIVGEYKFKRKIDPKIIHDKNQNF